MAVLLKQLQQNCIVHTTITHLHFFVRGECAIACANEQRPVRGTQAQRNLSSGL